LTSSWIVFSPDSCRYSSSLPGIDASAIVTCTPRIVFGGCKGFASRTGRGCTTFTRSAGRAASPCSRIVLAA
jgi:hypothetical protein